MSVMEILAILGAASFLVMWRVSLWEKACDLRMLLAIGPEMFAVSQNRPGDASYFNELIPGKRDLTFIEQVEIPSTMGTHCRIVGVLWHSSRGYQLAVYFWLLQSVPEVYMCVKEVHENSAWTDPELLRQEAFVSQRTIVLEDQIEPDPPSRNIVRPTFPR